MKNPIFNFYANFVDGYKTYEEENNTKIIELVEYFIPSKKQIHKNGICWFGGNGSGKTLHMSNTIKYIAPFFGYDFISIFGGDLTKDLLINIKRKIYAGCRYVFIDELGIDVSVKDYGNEIDNMTELLYIIFNHNEVNLSDKIYLFFTTNLNTDGYKSLSDRYGKRISDRFAENCNMRYFKNTSFRGTTKKVVPTNEKIYDAIKNIALFYGYDVDVDLLPHQKQKCNANLDICRNSYSLIKTTEDKDYAFIIYAEIMNFCDGTIKILNENPDIRFTSYCNKLEEVKKHISNLYKTKFPIVEKIDMQKEDNKVEYKTKISDILKANYTEQMLIDRKKYNNENIL